MALRSPTTAELALSDPDDDAEAAEEPQPDERAANLAELLARSAAADPDRVAVLQREPERRQLTWAELDRQVSAVAAGLAHLGLVAGHRLALLGPNSIDLVVAFLAALRAGVVVVPLGTRTGPEQVGRALAETGVRLLLSNQPFGGGELPVRPLTPPGLADLAGLSGRSVVSPADREALAVLLYTSGTSEDPRPAMLTHRALLSQLDQPTATGLAGPDAVIALPLPLSGVFAAAGVLGSWLAGGSSLVVLDERADLAAAVEAEQATHLPIAPPQLFRLLQAASADVRSQLRSLHVVISGGARLPWALGREFTERSGLRVDQGYGLTETGRGVSTTVGGALLGGGHVGRPLPGVEVRIGDGGEQDEPGEIFVRGEGLFSGYWPDGSGGPPPDGWWATGDIGYLSDGELFLLDRVRDLITVRGFPVYPTELEQVIGELPGVEAVAVVGVPEPGGAQQGASGQASRQRVLAFVSGTVRIEDVEEHCRQRLAPFRRPAEIRRVSRIPRTTTGLVRRSALRALAAAGKADGA